MKDSDGNVLWLFKDENNDVGYMTRYMPNGCPSYILGILATVFDAEIVDEYDYQFWGAALQEDFDRFISGQD